MNLSEAEHFIIGILSRELSPDLYYHGPHHTHDVVQAANWLAELEGITDPDQRILLTTAALYHDSGFLYTYQQHEEASCEIVRESLPSFDYTAEQIEQVCVMIMATKVPQSPRTHLERILCDADLDYLGRVDVQPVSQTLYQELLERHLLAPSENWNDKQIAFLQSHQYWTDTALARRKPGKDAYLQQLIQQRDSDS